MDLGYKIAKLHGVFLTIIDILRGLVKNSENLLREVFLYHIILWTKRTVRKKVCFWHTVPQHQCIIEVVSFRLGT